MVRAIMRGHEAQAPVRRRCDAGPQRYTRLLLPERRVALHTVPMSDWIGIIIAGLALAVSIFTWVAQNRRQAALERRADVSVYFHWLCSRARVAIPGREDVAAGYHLVLVNRGPAAAERVSLTIQGRRGPFPETSRSLPERTAFVRARRQRQISNPLRVRALHSGSAAIRGGLDME